jgi:propionate CoA-transferase
MSQFPTQAASLDQHAASARRAHRNKIVSAAEAVRLIHDGDTVTTGGFVGIDFPENRAVALEQRFLGVVPGQESAGQPRPDAHPCGHWGLVPRLRKLAMENRVHAHNLPQGIISHLFRDIAAGKPGGLARSAWAPSSTHATAVARSMLPPPKTLSN